MNYKNNMNLIYSTSGAYTVVGGKLKKTDMRTFLIFLILVMTLQTYAQVKVKGYYRKDGTYVQPHYRSSPDGNPYNNWSYPGNTNPYTGKTATGNPDTYLRNYYNRSSSSSSSSSYSYPSSTYSTPSSSSYNSTNTSYYSSYYVTANSLNVRSGPSVNYTVVGSLSKADNVKVIDSYSNGWRKVQYSYYDFDSYSYKTRTGYVSGSYLSTSNPYFNDSYLNYNYSNNTNTYSNLNANSSPYGYGNGRITIWTNCGTDGEIKVYLDGVYIGKLTQYFTNETPDCGESGTLSANKPAGTYKIEAKGNEYSWSGTITITKDRCLIQGLQK